MAKLEDTKPAPAPLPQGVREGSFLIPGNAAHELSLRPADFPGVQLVGGVKRPGTKSGKDWYAHASQAAAAAFLAKFKEE